MLLCSGKLYFDLEDKKENEGREDVAIVRLEQLYPLPENQLKAIHEKYARAIFYWVQEEPMNMGAASYLRMNLTIFNFYIIARKPGAATATGFGKIHAKEQEELLNKAFTA